VSDAGDVAHADFLRSRPDRTGLQGLIEHLEPGATIAGIRRLKGGLEASTHRVDVVTRAGARRPLVVRRFNRGARWYDPARLPREAAVLASLGPTPVPAPEALLVDVEGTWLGDPAMVLTCLAGGPAPPSRWVEWSGRLAAAMAEVHAVAPVVEAEPWLAGWRDDRPPESLAGDPWLDRVWPVLRSSAAELAASASGAGALVHHDLQPGNTLWSRGRVAGIVDWPMAGAGYPAYDRAYLRLDVSLCHGLEAGDGVAAASRALGLPDDHPAWDLVVGLRALPDPDLWVAVYRELGVEITEADGRARLAAWFERALNHLG
jgi:aminoglycoside phosphotransferase (APT) family kinase protein